MIFLANSFAQIYIGAALRKQSIEIWMPKFLGLIVVQHLQFLANEHTLMSIIKKSIIINLLLFIGTVPILGQGQAFSPEDRSFTIKMPAMPKCASERATVFREMVEVHICVYTDVPAQRFYSVTYLDRPRSSFAVDDKTALKAGYEGALAMSNSQVVSEREVTVDGFLGLECVWRANDINMSSTKLFVLTKQKMIIADISGQTGKIPADEIRAFLDTLRFTNNTLSRPK